MIALAPVGEAPMAEVEALVPVLAEAFGSEVVVAPVVSLAPAAHDARRRQYRSSLILDALARARRPAWERLLGVADVDLFVPKLNFVFGEADLRRGVALFSLARLRAEPPDRFRRRAATEAIHELGHTWGLGHCRDSGCVMWFSNTLAESDRKGTSFCAAHAAQLAHARGSSPDIRSNRE